MHELSHLRRSPVATALMLALGLAPTRADLWRASRHPAPGQAG